ncbi:MAG: glycerate kinase [Proteobacteria bacterium]|nr:glycerate kinase [Pseudomonadota bacterium]
MAQRAPVIVVAPDSFKGSLAAADVAAAMARGIRRSQPDADVRARPMADGGEGTLAAILAASAGARRLRVDVHGAAGDALATDVAQLADGTGVVEVAAIVGLTDPAGTAVDVTSRDTRGVGAAIRALLDRGCRRLMIGLGGSSTNDGGAGLLAALGLRFTDAAGRDLAPTPAALAALARVDASALDARLRDCELVLMSDVNNPLTGPRGATAVFGPQKGVAAADIARIDGVLARYADLVEAVLAKRAQDAPGAGAAGGLGYALQLLGAAFHSGADVVADAIGLDAALADADWAITGEGRSDEQTTMRKAPWVVAERARAHDVPVSLLSGAVDPAALPVLAPPFAGCFALPPGPRTLAESLAHADAWLADRADAMTRLRLGCRTSR